VDKRFNYGLPTIVNFAVALLTFAFVAVAGWWEYQFITVMWVVPSFGLLYLWFVDEVILKESNTYEEIIIKGNVAYAVLLLAHTLLILAGIAAAFLLYFSLKQPGL